MTGLRKTDFINSILFVIIIFVLWNRENLSKLKAYKQNAGETAIFGALAVLTQIGHYSFKYFVKFHQELAQSNVLAITLLKYLFNIVFVIFLALAIFNSKIFKEHFKAYKKQIPVFILLLACYFFIIQGFQMVWRYLGNFVAKSIYFLLSLSFDNVYLNINATRAPILGVGKFIVGISEECSGIDSLLLFLSLYGAIFALDRDRLNKKRMLLLLIPGIIVTVLYNILRVYVLILVGVFYSPEFAVDTFHTNAGWILFLIFFMIFWHFASKWLYTTKLKTR